MFSLFTREKRDGSYIMIFNLKQLNKHTKYEDSKMKSLQSVLNITRPNCRMAGVDLKDAFYMVPIHPDHQILEGISLLPKANLGLLQHPG